MESMLYGTHLKNADLKNFWKRKLIYQMPKHCVKYFTVVLHLHQPYEVGLNI